MKITNLVWNDIIVSHQTRKKEFRKNDHIDCAYITIMNKLLTISKYDDISYAYGNPKLIELTPWGCEFEAEWFGTSYYVDKQGKHRSKKMPGHKVKITAKF